MEEAFKEFEAKDLDGAIQQACEFFDTDRARLEIEILQDAKSGIFGIVGVRKAKIRAKRVHVREAVESILGRDGGRDGKDGDKKGKPREQQREKRPAPRAERAERQDHAERPNQPENAHKDEGADQRSEARNASRPERTERPERAERQERRRSRPAHAPEQTSARQQRPSVTRAQQPHEQSTLPNDNQQFVSNDVDDADAEGWSYPHTPLENLDREALIATVEEATRQIIRPIAGEPALLEVTVADSRVQVRLDCGEDSGLLIGREGITLAALQYILSRVVSCKMNASVRVQLDAGDYRRHQEDKLREMAQGLAERARQTGRSYSTRPLSSYHRRIVHLALQGMDDIQSRSSGDGALKRVVIARRRAERSERAGQ